MSSRQNTAGRLSLAALLRAARNTYALAIHKPLAQAGFDDIPRDGVLAISAVGQARVSAAQLGIWLGTSKQAVSQLIDTLVLRGYVERAVDEEDRRRMKLELTSRGKEVAAVCRKAVEEVERRLVEAVGKSHVEHTHATLTALAGLAAEWHPARPAPGS